MTTPTPAETIWQRPIHELEWVDHGEASDIAAVCEPNSTGCRVVVVLDSDKRDAYRRLAQSDGTAFLPNLGRLRVRAAPPATGEGSGEGEDSIYFSPTPPGAFLVRRRTNDVICGGSRAFDAWDNGRWLLWGMLPADARLATPAELAATTIPLAEIREPLRGEVEMLPRPAGLASVHKAWRPSPPMAPCQDVADLAASASPSPPESRRQRIERAAATAAPDPLPVDAKFAAFADGLDRMADELQNYAQGVDDRLSEDVSRQADTLRTIARIARATLTPRP